MTSAHIGYWTGLVFAGFGATVILYFSPQANPPLVCAIIGAFGLLMGLGEFVVVWFSYRAVRRV